jgi:hypothetical protein
MPEDVAVGRIFGALRATLGRPYDVKRGAALLYQVTVNNRLKVTVDPKAPARGQSAFQTDLCVFHHRRGGVALPRVVLEFKASLTTHDVLTYSTKARRHKQIYPYLRYGLVCSRDRVVPRRFFTHNDGLDFCIALAAVPRAQAILCVGRLVRAELRASRKLEEFAFGAPAANVFRSDPRATRFGLAAD